MGTSRNLDLKYRLALKAIGLSPKDPVYRAVQTFVPLLGLAKLKAVTLECVDEEDYLSALDALEIPSGERFAGGMLKSSTSIQFEDVRITIELPKKPSAWKSLLK